MDINLEMIKRIISSDELCDKVNSAEYSDSYRKQIESYVLSLCSDLSSINSNINYINRYIRKFSSNRDSKEDIFFDKVILKVYSFSIKNDEFNNILESFNFEEVKELLVQKYNQVVISNSFVNIDDLKKMLIFYCYACPNYIMPNDYINYFTYYLVSKSVVLDYDLISYFYKMFCLSFSISKNLNVLFEISDRVVSNDPYYEKKKKIIIYKQNIGDKVDYKILADIFYQIKYLYLVDGINSSSGYSFEQLRLVKEICLNSILGDNYFDKNYHDISFSNELRKQSLKTVSDYYSHLGLNVNINLDYGVISVSNDVSDEEDKCINIDVLFDVVLKQENPNLLRELLRSYPILGCEYKFDKRKSLLNLLLDIYKNKKLLINLNKDLEWHNNKLGNGEDEIIAPKVERLKNKIDVCTSYINVMSTSINNGDMTSSDLIRSISDLITYDTVDINVQNDICSILNVIVPNKIKRLCSDRSILYKEDFKKRVIKCYLDSMGLARNNFDSVYFMKIYSSLEICIKAFDID